MLWAIFCKCTFFMEDTETLLWLYETLCETLGKSCLTLSEQQGSRNCSSEGFCYAFLDQE